VTGFHRQILRQNKMKVDKDMGARPTGPKLMDVDPHRAAVISDHPADLFQELGVRGIHEPG